MFRRRRSSDDFAEEIKAHLELEADELKRDGWSDEQARRKAKVHFGNVGIAQERFKLRNRIAWLDNIARDLRFAMSLTRIFATGSEWPILFFRSMSGAMPAIQFRLPTAPNSR